MRIIFMGTPRYATKILEGLIKEFEVVALFTQPDRPVGRKQILTPPDTKRFLQTEAPSIPIYQPKSLKEPEVIKEIEALSPDFIIVAAYGQILPKEILEIAPCINLHASLLPKYRGASPIQQALLEGETVSGVTAMLMDEGLDTGDILGFEVVEIKEDDDALSLFEKLAIAASKLTPLILRRFFTLAPLKQRDVDATYCKKIRKSDGLVDFKDARTIYNKYRAFIQWPGIFLESGLKLKRVALGSSEGVFRAGEILGIEDEYIKVGCQRGWLKVYRVQPPGKKEMDGASYLRGRRLKVGDMFL